MSSLRRAAVYCGAHIGDDARFVEAAQALGRLLASRGIAVVYGGGNIGLMGALADATLEAGGEVIGVIPEALLCYEVAHEGLTGRIEVDGMHARKATMAWLSDAFIALPGGFGTLDELFEATTWTQLGYHQKPVGLLNVAGYYDGLIAFLDHASSHGFITAEHREIVVARDTPQALVEVLEGSLVPRFAPHIDRP